MLGIFLAPISLSLKKSNFISLDEKVVKAQTTQKWYLEVGENEREFNSQQECQDARAALLQNPISGIIKIGDCTNESKQNTFKSKLKNCAIGSLMGCVIHIVYFFFVSIPSFLMGVAGKIVDFLAVVTLNSDMYRLPFVQTIWTIVRDFANIFFILVLLYAAFQVILGLGHGGGKKIIASVILMALLVNFSLFISRVIIDSSNVLALIFYNKIECEVKHKDGSVTNCEHVPVTKDTSKVVEKPLTLSLVKSIRIDMFFKPEFLQQLPKDPKYWETDSCKIRHRTDGVCYDYTLSTEMALAMMITYGIFIWPMVWIFFKVGLTFLSRIVMLILYMVISPFAFVTATTSKFSNIDTIGFNSWIKKLIETSFFITIFMAILYLVARIMSVDLFGSVLAEADGRSIEEAFIIIFIPFVLVFILLKKGSDYAMKATGELTGALLSGVKILGGVALGGAALGAAGVAVAGRQTLGAVNKYTQNDSARKNVLTFKDTKKDWDKARTSTNVFKKAQYGVSGAFKGLRNAPKALAALGGEGLTRIGRQTDATGNVIRKGWFQRQEEGLGKKELALSKLNSKADAEFGGKGKYEKGVQFKDLNEGEQMEVRKAIDKDSLAQQKGWSNFENVRDINEKRSIDQDVDQAYDNFNRADKSTAAKLAQEEQFRDTYIGINKADKRASSMVSNAKMNAAIGEFVTSLRKGSYDVRNLSDIKRKGLVTGLGATMIATGVGAPIGLGLMAGSSGALRNALKQGASEYGKGQKDFLKDLGEILTGAFSSTLKNAKVKAVEIEKGGGHGGGDHGGGGGHH